MRSSISGLVSALWFLLAPAPLFAGFELVMVEEAGCIYCARWNAEIAPEYPVTPEGRFAPLRRVDLHDLPDDVAFASRPVFTPTFVLVEDGAEIGRLEGYAGEDFFWGLLGRLLSIGDPGWADAAQP
ncbi:hypothetical protein HKCCE2091_02515 [Rhodobacterales bacterium HKCCE2091]|nr:hypothetical protein [Rhodobacterales bacterium HKCCE2091]